MGGRPEKAIGGGHASGQVNPGIQECGAEATETGDQLACQLHRHRGETDQQHGM